MPSTSQSSHAPLASLAAHWHACKGDIPPPLVGASVTLVDNNLDPAFKAKIYLFGGRLVTTRRMVNDLYELDLLTLRWTKLSTDDDDDDKVASDADDADAQSSAAGPSSSALRHTLKPQPRYFHSCNLWNNKLIVFGGMGYVDGNEAELGVLNQTVAFDLETRSWDLAFGPADDDEEQQDLVPQARYAHLSSTTADSLIIIGGQDMANRYVEEINVFNLHERRWNVKQAYDKQRGSYRSLAIEPLWEVEEPNVSEAALAKAGELRNRSDSLASLATPSSRKSEEKQRLQQQHPLLSRNNISMLPMSSRSWDVDGKMKPLPVYVYTNYNFTDVKREMEVVRLEKAQGEGERFDVYIDDQSKAMSGLSLPPGLRFPMGAILGVHLLISGTYLANTSQTFAIWALHLPTMTWSRLDVGPLLSSGSWNRGILWPSQGRLVVFGHRDRDLVADYNHRQTNWNHVLLIELEAWGITQAPVKHASLASVQLGLEKLASSTIGSFSASLESGLGAVDDESEDPLLCFGGRGDFEIVCSDGMRLGCDRVILEQRWPWFANQMKDYQRRVKSSTTTATKLDSPTRRGSSRPGTGEQLTALLEEDERAGTSLFASLGSHIDPRITPRQLHIGEPSPVMLALLIFLYTRCICTQLQRHPAIVSALLIVSKVYGMSDLEVWAKHAAHVIMSRDLAPPSSSSKKADNASNSDGALPILERHRLAVALYEAATMSGFEALQIRALRTVMSIAKWVQRSSVSSTRSSATGDSQEERHHPSALTTPVTASAMEQQQQLALNASSAVRTPDGLAPAVMSPFSGGGKPDGLVRRPSRADRTHPAQSGEAVDEFGVSGGGGNSMNGSLSRTSTNSGVSGGPSSQYAPMQQQQAQQQQRPSVSNGTNSLSRPPPPVSQSTGTRKRFSIFGRTSDHHKANNANVAATAAEPLTEERSARSSVDQHSSSTPTLTRLQRTNTEGSAGGESSGKSVSSAYATQGSGGAMANAVDGSSTSSLPTTSTGTSKNGSDVSTAATLTQAREGGMASSTGRKMSSTLSRLKSSNRTASGNAQGSGGGNAGTGGNNTEDAVTGATVITGAMKLPSAASEGAGDARKGSAPSGNAKLGAGQLNKKDIKALQGIFA